MRSGSFNALCSSRETSDLPLFEVPAIGLRKKCLSRREVCPYVSRGHVLITQMLALVPVRAELVTAPALGQAREAPGQARVSGWVKRPVRQRLVQVRVTCALT